MLDSNELTFVLWPILWNDTGTTPLLSKNISLEMVYQYIFWYKSLLHVDKNWRIEIKTKMNVKHCIRLRNYYRFVTIVLPKFCFIISLIPLRTVSSLWSQAKQSLVLLSHSLNNYRELYGIALQRMALHFVVMYGQIRNLIICCVSRDAFFNNNCVHKAAASSLPNNHLLFILLRSYFSILFLFALISRAPIKPED